MKHINLAACVLCFAIGMAVSGMFRGQSRAGQAKPEPVRELPEELAVTIPASKTDPAKTVHLGARHADAGPIEQLRSVPYETTASKWWKVEIVDSKGSYQFYAEPVNVTENQAEK